MVYIKDGWGLIEHDNGHIERVCRESEYRAEAVTARLGPQEAKHAPTVGTGLTVCKGNDRAAISARAA
jgi:hypothetical protein